MQAAAITFEDGIIGVAHRVGVHGPTATIQCVGYTGVRGIQRAKPDTTGLGDPSGRLVGEGITAVLRSAPICATVRGDAGYAVNRS
ncbi:hypothetical protein C8Q78DRAFT_751685 [Trametes maxima]|nr:hypothetical protein C8Q78DRAFT_751685 [Trametes maxima]